MAKKTTPRPAEIDEVEELDSSARARLFEASHKVLLAALGAAALAQEEMEDFLSRLVERGEIAEKDARKLVKEVTDKRRKNIEKDFDKRMETVLDRMDIPSKADIDALSEKIAALTEKIEGLKK